MLSNHKIWYLLVFLSLLGVTFLLYVSDDRGHYGGADVIKSMTSFTGVTFEASGVASVAGTSGVLIVDNGRHGQVFWMRLDEAGTQAGEVKTINLGVSIEDIEGITTDGTYFYVVSSQSRPKAIANAGLVRFKFDPNTHSVAAVESIGGLKKFLVENVAELRDEGDRKSKQGGINIEGLAWDPQKNRLLVGLRSPLVNGRALLVPLEFQSFSIDNLQVEKSIALDLGGVGIRGVEYDKQANGFKIISGATEVQAQVDFGLWEWNGDEIRPALREIHKIDKALKPEGVSRAKVGSRDQIIIVFDAGGYKILN